MKNLINFKALSVALGFVVVGIIGLLLTVFLYRSSILENVFCSIIGSGLTLFFTNVYVDVTKKYEVWDDWKLEKIFKSRADKNHDSDPKLENSNISQLDIIAFGLSSFRSFHTNDVLNRLNHGMNVRILVMHPKGKYISQREVEEGDTRGNISKSILDLVEWAKNLNVHSSKGKIALKYYCCMTLDFYWRLDDELYIGPYMNGKKSQQTITYKFIKGGKGFNIYTDYFEERWCDLSNEIVL